MIEYEEEWLFPLLFKVEGSVAFKACFYAVPSALLAVILVYMEEWQPGITEELGVLPGLSGSHIWNAATGVLMLLLAFRTRTAFARFWEGTGLLHQMRGEWFDTVSNCVTFSISAKALKPEGVTSFRHALVRLMSLCHGSALEEIAGGQIVVDSIDVSGLDEGTLRHLRDCDVAHGFNKVEVMLHLVQSLITKAHYDAILRIPPPILSRVYQTISRGFVNQLNAKKITDTKFPFPHAQLIASLLLIDTIITPIMIGQAVRSKILAALFTFVPIFGMYCLNFIAGELENPFGVDDNDLPLGRFQDEMNSCLLMLLHPNTDMIAGTSSRCITSFDDLLEAVTNPSSARHASRLSAYDMTRMDRVLLGEDPDVPGQRISQTENSSDVLSQYVKKAPSSTDADPTPSPPPPSSPRLEALQLPKADLPPAAEVAEPAVPTMSAEEMRRLREEEAIRLEAAQREVEKRMNEFYLALQRWMLMIERQVRQIHEILSVLRLLSETAGDNAKPGGWEHAIHPV